MADKLLFLFLLLVPTQLGKHFWPEWSLVNGIRSDYLSPTLYLVDIVWLMWIVVTIIKYLDVQIFRVEKETRIRQKYLVLSGIIFFVLMNIWLAENRWVAGYRWLRVWQWLVTVWILRKDHRNEIDGKDETHWGASVRGYLKIIIPIWIVLESGLGLAQVAKNGSLQGIFYWLGERKFDYMTIGTATMSWWHEVRVRAYGTFSHPNSMSGFILASWLIWEMICERADTSGRPYITKMMKWIVRLAALTGVIITGSRMVWLVGIVILIFRYLAIQIFGTKHGDRNEKRETENENTIKRYKWIVNFIMMISLGIFVWIMRNSGGWDNESLSKRIDLMKASWEMIKNSPLFGMGAGNFVAELPKYVKSGVIWLQPVHNVLLLVWSEIGLVGMGLIGWVLLKILSQQSLILQLGNKEEKIQKMLILGTIIIIGMADHYWLTLTQNMWLVAIVVALI